MPAEVFRGAVHDHGYAEVERPAEQWCGERVVDEKGHAALASHGGDCFQVRDPAQRIGDRLGDDQAGALQAVADSIEVGQVDEANLITRGLEVLAQQRGGAAVQLPGGDDSRRPGDKGEDRAVQRRHPRCGRHTHLSSFELGDGTLEHLAVGVGIPSVVVARLLAAGDGIVVGQVGEHVDRGRAQVGRQRTASPQLAARVDGARGGLHLSAVRPA